jgi:tight adherence protein C
MELIFSPISAAALLALAVFAGVLAFRPSRSAKTVETRMESYLTAEEARQNELHEVRGTFWERAIAPALHGFVRTVGRLLPNRTVEEIQTQLMLAGRPGNLSGVDFLGVRVLAATGGLALGFMFAMRMGNDRRFLLLGPLMGALLGYMAPQSWLSGRIRKRRESLQRSLPDALDMLTICVEAGLAFESAMQRVSEQWVCALSEEFARTVAEVRLGVPRPQALRRLSQRCDVPDISSFVAVLVQADSMGTSIAQVLRSQANQIRLLRRQRAEEKANQAPIKVIMAMMMFIFPALFVIILGPAVPKIVVAFSGFGE